MARTNAISFPSGDHCGLSSSNSPALNDWTFPVATFTTYTFDQPVRFETNAISLPSGDQVAELSTDRVFAVKLRGVLLSLKGTTQISPFAVNMIDLPSGDHLGLLSG